MQKARGSPVLHTLHTNRQYTFSARDGQRRQASRSRREKVCKGVAAPSCSPDQIPCRWSVGILSTDNPNLFNSLPNEDEESRRVLKSIEEHTPLYGSPNPPTCCTKDKRRSLGTGTGQSSYSYRFKNCSEIFRFQIAAGTSHAQRTINHHLCVRQIVHQRDQQPATGACCSVPFRQIARFILNCELFSGIFVIFSYLFQQSAMLSK